MTSRTLTGVTEDMTKDDGLPSGEWTGFFTRSKVKGINVINLSLEFRERRVAGTGWLVASNGSVRFVLLARYLRLTQEIVGMTRYDRKLRIRFCGFGDGIKRGLWGTWNHSGSLRGGFQIWPVSDVSQEAFLRTGK